MSWSFAEPFHDDPERDEDFESLCSLPADPDRPWIGHPREAEFEHFVAEQERLQAECTCEYDGGYGDDGSQVRRFPKPGCPTHAEEDAEEAA